MQGILEKEMAGYGNADDHVGATQAHIDDSLELQRASGTPQDNKTGECQECGDDIPANRLTAMPNCRHCLICQQQSEQRKSQRSLFTYRTGYTP